MPIKQIKEDVEVRIKRETDEERKQADHKKRPEDRFPH
jgi:hypothetical protein